MERLIKMIIKCFTEDTNTIQNTNNIDSRFLINAILEYASKNKMIKTHIFKKLNLSTMIVKERRLNLESTLNRVNDKLTSINEEIVDINNQINSNIVTLRNNLNKNI